MEKPDQLVNILTEHFEKNMFLWMTRPIKFSRSNETAPLADAVDLKKRAYQIVLQKLTDICEKKLGDKSTLKLIASTLNEIGLMYSLPVIRWLGLALSKIMKRSLTGLYVNVKQLDNIKRSMGHSPVVFVPTHRSYADFVLMAFICFNYGIEIPFVAAGMDFQAMAVVGRILRDCKAFYMKRSFSGDPLYKMIFESYINALITYGGSPVEFFIEGTRSRTGKSLWPKYGFLSMVAEQFFAGDVPDITIVPVAITYDRILEDKLFAFELLGIPKPKESTKGLFKAWDALNENYGNIYFNFGSSLSIRDYLTRHPYRTDELKKTEFAQVKKLAHTIIHRHKQLQVSATIHILCIVLLGRIYTDKKASIPMDLASWRSKYMLSFLEHMGAKINVNVGALKDSIRNCSKVNHYLINIDEDDEISVVSSYPAVAIDNMNVPVKGIRLSQEMMSSSIPLVLLQIYANTSLPWLIQPALIMRILSESTILTKHELFELFKYGCFLFEMEFLLDTSDLAESFAKCFKDLKIMGCLQCLDDGMEEGEDEVVELGFNEFGLILSNLLLPFAEGYLALGYTLLSMGEPDINNDHSIITVSQAFVVEQLSKTVFKHPYSLTLDLQTVALNSLRNLKIISKTESGGNMVDDVELEKLMKFLGSNLTNWNQGNLLKSRL